MTIRSKAQEDADNFDCELFRLITMAERAADKSRGQSQSRWTDVVRALNSARPNVRAEMHPDDRKRAPL